MAGALLTLSNARPLTENQAKLMEYTLLSEKFEAPAENALLASHRERALALRQIDRREALEAQGLGKQGQHEEAAGIYARLHEQGVLRPEDRKSWGWELYHLARAELQKASGEDLSPAIVQRVKRCLNTCLTQALREPEYRSPSPRPTSRGKPSSVNLHSLMLNLALRLAKGNHLKALRFVRMWNLDHFTEEDFTSQAGSDGKTYPSLAERAIQAAASEAIDSDRPDDLRFILPHVESALKRFPENIWLKLYLVKLLRGLRRTDEARKLAIEFAREKATEYWVWDLIAELSPDDPELQLSCWAKALICSQDNDFVSKVRLKFAALIANHHPAEARFEVERGDLCGREIVESRRLEATDLGRRQHAELHAAEALGFARGQRVDLGRRERSDLRGGEGVDLIGRQIANRRRGEADDLRRGQRRDIKHIERSRRKHVQLALVRPCAWLVVSAPN
jgi:hypothetical protein